jgi:phosphonate transport system permease protein
METNKSQEALWTHTTIYKKTAYDNLPLMKMSKARIVMRITLISLVLLTFYSFFTFDYRGINILEAVSTTTKNFKVMFSQPRLNHFGFLTGLHQVGITLGLAFLTTLLGAVFAFFLGLVAAQNLSSPAVSNAIKGFVAVIRSIDTVLWVLIFAVAAGLGSVAAVMGMTFHTFGYLIKAYSETFEELDPGIIEALRGSGANWWQIVFQAIVPSSATGLLSWTFLRFEVNYVVAVAMGAAAGAGGIGFDLFMASNHYYDLREIGVITYFILSVAILLEMISVRLKHHLVAD